MPLIDTDDYVWLATERDLKTYLLVNFSGENYVLELDRFQIVGEDNSGGDIVDFANRLDEAVVIADALQRQAAADTKYTHYSVWYWMNNQSEADRALMQYAADVMQERPCINIPVYETLPHKQE